MHTRRLGQGASITPRFLYVSVDHRHCETGCSFARAMTYVCVCVWLCVVYRLEAHVTGHSYALVLSTRLIMSRCHP